MEKIISSVYRKLLFVLVFFLIIGNLSGCRGKYYFFQKDGIYSSQDPFLELDCRNNTGTMIVNGITYKLDLAFKPDGTGISIYADRNSDQWVLDTIKDDTVFIDKLIWKTKTKEKNGKLYLTITRDNISDYEGKTIVLEFRPNEQ